MLPLTEVHVKKYPLGAAKQQVERLFIYGACVASYAYFGVHINRRCTINEIDPSVKWAYAQLSSRKVQSYEGRIEHV